MSRIGTQQTHGGETCAVFLQSAISAGAAGMAELILAKRACHACRRVVFKVASGENRTVLGAGRAD
jgi:hypothetical protein